MDLQDAAQLVKQLDRINHPVCAEAATLIRAIIADGPMLADHFIIDSTDGDNRIKLTLGHGTTPLAAIEMDAVSTYDMTQRLLAAYDEVEGIA
jgi:hypothetical protein